MNRRDALERVALLMGGLVSAPTITAFLEGCTPGTQSASEQFTGFSADQLNLVSEIAETILPATDTPGAKDAKVGGFVELMLKDCYYPKDQNSFLKGLEELSKKEFLKASPEEREKLLSEAEDYAYRFREETAQKRSQAKESQQSFEEPGVPFFALMKELTLLGYFTSEVGATLALDYLPVPGRYEGCIDLKEEQKAWAI
ncbi:MAG: twin-arginine translocation pathway signal protein [Cytophagaceae bacterium SCN 52-12]|nr:MAG: twin-arginine translocation pathway signal protein [Cytophagaceae bacterium SCN 52-12]